MITLADLQAFDPAGNWDQDKVDELGDVYQQMVYRMKLKQYAPEWEDADETTTSEPAFVGARTYTKSAVLVTGQFFVKASDLDALYRHEKANEDSGDHNWSAATTLALAGDAVALTTSKEAVGEDARVMYAMSTKAVHMLKAASLDDDTIATASISVDFLGGTVGKRFHFASATSKGNWRLGYYDGSAFTLSDVYWPFKVYGFDATRLDDGTDVIVLSTELPPIHDFTVNDRKIEPAFHYIGAIVAFKFDLASESWSDHIVIWKNEREENNPKPDGTYVDALNIVAPGKVTITTYDDEYGSPELFVIAPIDIGYADNMADRYCLGIFKSRNGVGWEAPIYYATKTLSRGGWPFYVTASFDTSPVFLARNGDYMYMINPRACQRAKATCWMGDACDDNTQTVTNYVMGLTLEAGKQRAMTVDLTNPAFVLTTAPGLLAKEYAMRGYVWIGWHSKVNDEEVDLLVPQFVGEVISVADKVGLPEKAITVTLADPMEFVQMIGSSDAVEWPGMSGGGDNYAGTESGINHSGLGRVAPETGSWVSGVTADAANGGLMLKCEAQEGIARTTMIGSRSWNGLLAATMRVFPGNSPELDGYTWQGLMFREADKRNMFFVKWLPTETTARISLYRRYVGCYNNTVQNGTFDADASWTKGTGWTITGGEAVHVAGSSSSVEQDLDNTAIGCKYIVKFNITSLSAGSVTVVLGSTSCPARTEVGHYEETYDAAGNELVMAGSAHIKLTASSDFAGKVDDVEIVPVPMDYELPDYTGGVGIYSYDASDHPYDGGRITVRWRYSWVEVFFQEYGETTVSRILYYELIGQGSSSAQTKVSCEGGITGYQLYTGGAGFIAYTENDSQDNLLEDYNPGAEIDPLVWTTPNSNESGWSLQLGAAGERSTDEFYRGVASIHVTAGADLLSSGIRFARYFSASDSVAYGDTYRAEAWLKIDPNVQPVKNTLKAFIEVQYVVGKVSDHTISEYQMFKYKTDNNGWFKWQSSVIAALDKRPVKVIIEIFQGNGEAEWISIPEPMEWYVDKVRLISTLIPSRQQYILWSDVHASDAGMSYTMDDICDHMLAYAGIGHDDSYTYDGCGDWTLSGGMTGDIESTAGNDSLALSDQDFAPSFAIEFDRVSDAGQVFLFGNRSTAQFNVIWTATDVSFKQGLTTRKLPIVLPASCHMKLAVYSRSDNAKPDRLGMVDWVTIALYANDAYVASDSFPVDDLDEMIGRIGLGSYNTLAFEVANVWVDSMYRLSLFSSIDPGEKVSDGMSRTLANQRTLVFSRFNGHVIVKRYPTSYSVDWTGASDDRVEGYGKARMSIPPNMWRVYGAWKQTDYVAHEAHQKAWRRIFEKTDNPNLMNSHEMRREVQYLIQDIAGALDKPSITMPYYPLLEMGDTILWNGDKILLESIRTAFASRGDGVIYNNEVSGRRVL